MFRTRFPVITTFLLAAVALSGCLGGEEKVDTGPKETVDVAEGANVESLIFQSEKFAVSGTIEKHTETDDKSDNVLCSLTGCEPDILWWYTWDLTGLIELGNEEEAGELNYQIWLSTSEGSPARAPGGESTAPNGTMQGSTPKREASSFGEYTRVLLTIESQQDATVEILVFDLDGLEVGSPLTVQDVKPFDGVIGNGKLEPAGEGSFNVSTVIHGLEEPEYMRFVLWLDSESLETPKRLGVLAEDPQTGGHALSTEIAESDLKAWKLFVSVESPDDEGFPDPSGLTLLRSKFVK